MKGSFWKGFALGVLGLFLWIFFSFLDVFSESTSKLVGSSFMIMIFCPILFWVILPYKEKWYDKGKKKQFYFLLVPITILFLIFLAVILTL